MDARLKKALEKARASSKVREAEDAVFGKTHPVLHAFLTSTDAGEKGKHREPGTLFVFTSDGLWKGVLGEKTENASLWGSSDTLQGLLDALERALTSENPDWRAKGPGGKFTSRRKA